MDGLDNFSGDPQGCGEVEQRMEQLPGAKLEGSRPPAGYARLMARISLDHNFRYWWFVPSGPERLDISIWEMVAMGGLEPPTSAL